MKIAADNRYHIEMSSTVFPTLFERLDGAFPEFGWVRNGRLWQASSEEHTRTLPGSPRPARVQCYENTPFGFTVHGEGFTAWLTYINDGVKPTGKTFIDAAKKLFDLAGVEFQEREVSEEELKRFEKRERRSALLETFFRCCKDELDRDDDQPRKARAYLKRRGFEEPLLRDLPLGLYPSPEKVKKHLGEEGFTEEVESLLATHWTGRLVIAWRDRYGVIGTLAGRDITGSSDKKYVYLSTGCARRKSELVAFGLDTALKNGGKEHLVLVEGLFDSLLLQSRGLENVAAIGGSGEELSVQRFESLVNFGVKNVTLALDFDPKSTACSEHGQEFCQRCSPGMKGTLKSVDNAQSSGSVNLSVVPPSQLWEAAGRNEPPDKVDPDSLVQSKGIDAFRGVLKKRVLASMFCGNHLLEGVTHVSPNCERHDAVSRVLDFADSIKGAKAGLEREDLLLLLEDRTGYSFETLAEMFQEQMKEKQKEEARKGIVDVLRKASADIKKGEPDETAQKVITKLSKHVDTEEPPPAFSVERLEQESMTLPEGLPFGWKSVDKKLGVAMNPAELTVIAGRTAHAKTTVMVAAMNNCLHAQRDGIFVFYSMEEPELRIFHRLLSLSSAPNAWMPNDIRDYYRHGCCPENSEEKNLEQAKEDVRSFEKRLLVVHRSSWTVEQITAHARDLNDREPIKAVFVDYLQRIQPPEGRFDRRDQEVTAIARMLREVAIELQVPVVVGAQINREAVKEAGKNLSGKYGDKSVMDSIKKGRPQLHHLREGGSEQEADLILGLLNYRADYTEDVSTGDKVPDITRLDIGTLKTRYGTPGRWVEMGFDGRYGLVTEPGEGVRCPTCTKP